MNTALLHLPLRAATARRAVVALLAGLGLWLGGAGQAAAFGFDEVAQRAQAEAAAPYVAPAEVLPAELASLNYDQYRDIRFRPERALWREQKLPFELMFFHLGKGHTSPVLVNEVSAQGVRHIDFNAADYHYGKNRLSPAGWGDLGHAGFRVHYPLNSTDYKDELVVFLGASYFRALGAGQQYGLSARGLAIDTVGGAAGEEFPRFKEFWIERPAPKASSLVIHALLDSPRATGAYQFTLRPGKDTVVDVRTRLFLRAGVDRFGIAPLTSMFQHGENDPRPGEFRPEVHDSDGLMLHSGEGEWLWRPLLNPTRKLVTSFATHNPKGFGLMQRDRQFRSYEDLEARYERRPSTWVVPQGNWGAGRVELVQLPTADETNDNVVAYWVPEQLPAVGQPLDLSWRMQWQGDQQVRPPTGWTVQSRSGRGFRPLPENEHQYVIDFAGPALDALPPDAAVKASVSVEGGQLVDSHAFRNDATEGWRMTFRIKPNDATQPTELRAFLQYDNNALTETWTTPIPAR